ncbi:4-hydroxy-3-methylbut-2-en-1-yl diphosphate synthase [Seohaeicola zhoushanensis]|uniref:4-hydroxy-3-methylbut-2-en-1-yl diphosphate synthase n=2 Tax=Seohaeicola zhoushanensis TaxID=1569283 RepID=A0A8J3H320_9RHOB|nr:4-hydroxy-3-methylbut-2-en-1-yl diphosphate synthase [Seohaeicola zhoushanensis]
MGKSLLDVQRELRIKASYIAAIENSDPSAFDTPGFIAGYVRSYARYLGMDPDESFTTFCRESGFAVAHGMSAEASVVKNPLRSGPSRHPMPARDIFAAPNTPFAPVGESLLSRIEPRALGSTMVLLALIGGIGFGGWTLLKEVQQVKFAPVDQAPVVLSELDPLATARNARPENARMVAPSVEAFDRLYRPQALDVPVLVARDAPISTLDPRNVGTFRAPGLPEVQDSDGSLIASAATTATATGPTETVPQVVETPGPALQVVAVRTSWVQIKDASGTVIYEATMQPGDSWEAPLTEEPPRLRTGESGAIYFAMSNKFYGPVGKSGQITSNLPLSVASLKEAYLPVEIGTDAGLVRYAEARGISAPAAD